MKRKYLESTVIDENESSSSTTESFANNENDFFSTLELDVASCSSVIHDPIVSGSDSENELKINIESCDVVDHFDDFIPETDLSGDDFEKKENITQYSKDNHHNVIDIVEKNQNSDMIYILSSDSEDNYIKVRRKIRPRQSEFIKTFSKSRIKNLHSSKKTFDQDSNDVTVKVNDEDSAKYNKDINNSINKVNNEMHKNTTKYYNRVINRINLMKDQIQTTDEKIEYVLSMLERFKFSDLNFIQREPLQSRKSFMRLILTDDPIVEFDQVFLIARILENEQPTNNYNDDCLVLKEGKNFLLLPSTMVIIAYHWLPLPSAVFTKGVIFQIHQSWTVHKFSSTITSNKKIDNWNSYQYYILNALNILVENN